MRTLLHLIVDLRELLLDNLSNLCVKRRCRQSQHGLGLRPVTGDYCASGSRNSQHWGVFGQRVYDWTLQQAALLLLLTGCSVHQCCNCTRRARSTVRRWRDWLDARGDSFGFFLRSRFPELGRYPERVCLWRHVMQGMSLAQAMAWCDRELIVP